MEITCQVIRFGPYQPYELTAKYGAEPIPEGVAVILPPGSTLTPADTDAAGKESVMAP